MLQTLPRSKTLSGAAYLERGEGAETLVLIHGVGMRIEAWQPQIDRLANDFRVVAVDLPGHGFSDPLEGAPELPVYVEWFRRFLEDIKAGPVNVAGHSMGALIAGGIVATAPEQLRRVALLNGVHRRGSEARKAVEARAREIGSGNFDRVAPLTRWFSENEEGTEAYRLVRELLQAVDPVGYALAYKAFASGDAVYAHCWPKVECPALFLTGDGDLNSTGAMARDMAAAARRGRAVVIEGHRHMVNLTAPEEVNRALADWLASS
ncbi:alpha/beta hydrolase [Sinorhizobium meliloti]|uniref:alpha/beta fold hydrolase n=1 Tax=Rhizobium meliloti TaxID=382 RepID=UPI000FD9FE7A|nr:alpha/beta hydrolase [Sinorhizobium meliloti]MDE3823008.1 alpha/beta hydrolase [Sinorhizobium meliloti]RVM41539.1 alpha/beta hydrolase [Sinorhizobium meliloti]RVN59158.1 alpha/beta hydrolase [Sinorhizobium meliloti]RVO29090.1 alpha/beta hydrolase [Sinorhizobium meliloti]RVP53784.1 alpha/beta hydrolase [Sinorhizobium meliloti]